MNVNDQPIVTTSLGAVRGSTEGVLSVFRGIPFAAPPVGEARWNAARPHSGWDGVLDATAYGPTAPQPYVEGGSPLMGTHGDPPFDEDCLTLNVWTPGADDALRPVLVWIHGGGFLTGSGNLPIYSGASYARDGDLVVVAINYRVGALGFAHGLGDTANPWLTDQVAAMEWITENIAAFGGDPAQVTVAGQSGGGFSIGALAGHPRAASLFQKAIVQSPPMGLRLPVPDEAIKRTETLARALGHSDIEGLRDEPWERLIEGTFAVIAQYAEFGEWGLAFLPVLDEQTMPRHPAEVLDDGRMDLVIGWTSDEATFGFAMDPVAQAASREQVVEWAGRRHDGAGEQLYEAYARSRDRTAPSEVLIDMITDDLFRRRSWEIADRRAAEGRPVRVFQFDLSSPWDDGVLGAPHCFDLPFAFANFEHWGQAGFLDGLDTETRDRVAAQLHGSLIAFVRGENPEPLGVGRWRRYAADDPAVLVLDSESSISASLVPAWKAT